MNWKPFRRDWSPLDTSIWCNFVMMRVHISALLEDWSTLDSFQHQSMLVYVVSVATVDNLADAVEWTVTKIEDWMSVVSWNHMFGHRFDSEGGF
jgi:hypothetical protein